MKIRRQGRSHYAPGNGNKDTVRRRLIRYLKHHNLQKPPCEICAQADPAYIEAHHVDYSKPYHVRWLCVKHHRMLHLEIIPVYELVILREIEFVPHGTIYKV